MTVPRTVALQCGDGGYVPVIAEIGNHRFESTLLPAKEGDFCLVVPVVALRSDQSGKQFFLHFAGRSQSHQTYRRKSRPAAGRSQDDRGRYLIEKSCKSRTITQKPLGLKVARRLALIVRTLTVSSIRGRSKRRMRVNAANSKVREQRESCEIISRLITSLEG